MSVVEYAREALMLVHSFDPADSSLDTYQAFAAALGLPNPAVNRITDPLIRGEVTLRLGWSRSGRCLSIG